MLAWFRIVALCLGLAPASVLAQGQATPSPDPSRGVSPYDAPLAEPDKPLVPSFQKGPNKAGGPANELNTNDGRATERPPGGSVAGAVTGTELYHGNFCGRGNRGAHLAAADELDAACKRHDECFDRTNRSCSCNETLRRDAYRVSELRTASRELRARALSVLQAAGAIECRGS